MDKKNFSEAEIVAKIKKAAGAAGCELLCKALQLYFILLKPGLPKWARASIVGALAYFISPIDAIPDLAPILGYSDDLTVVALAIAAVAMHLDENVKARSHDQLEKLLGKKCDCS